MPHPNQILHHFASLQWNSWLLGKAEVEGNFLWNGHTWEKTVSAFQNGKPQQPFPAFKLKDTFSLWLMITVRPWTCRHLHIQLTTTHITNSISLATYWLTGTPSTRQNEAYGLLEPAGNKHITETKPLSSTKQTKHFLWCFSININTGVILILKWTSTSLQSYSPTCLELQKDI